MPEEEDRQTPPPPMSDEQPLRSAILAALNVLGSGKLCGPEGNRLYDEDMKPVDPSPGLTEDGACRGCQWELDEAMSILYGALGIEHGADRQANYERFRKVYE